MKNTTDAARMHLKKAIQDKIAAAILAEHPDCADMTIGFHLQQAYEKGLKAVLSYRKIPFRKTHDIGELIDLLRKNLTPIPVEFEHIEELSPFGVEMRNDDLPVGTPEIDRKTAIRELEMFLTWIMKQTGITI